MSMFLNSLLDCLPDDNGAFGEQIVNSIFLFNTVKARTKALYKDVYVKSGDWVYQIDHIVIMDFGVVVIETKHLQAKNTYGKPNELKWRNGKTVFFNPIMQNNAHVRAVSKFINKDIPIYSIIVFSNSNKPVLSPSNVFKLREFKEYLENYNLDKPISNDEIEIAKSSLDEIVSHKKEYLELFKEQLKQKVTV